MQLRFLLAILCGTQQREHGHEQAKVAIIQKQNPAGPTLCEITLARVRLELVSQDAQKESGRALWQVASRPRIAAYLASDRAKPFPDDRYAREVRASAALPHARRGTHNASCARGALDLPAESDSVRVR